jgi:hypothetical protein
MPFALEALGDSFRGVIAKWTAITAIWTFLLYGAGYLSLRFQLTAFGVGTDLSVLDERYVFEGAKFLLTLVLVFPLALALAVPTAALVWVAGRLLPGARSAIVQRWTAQPRYPLAIGIVFAVALIQIVMSKCLIFNNLLIAPTMPSEYGYTWFADLLLGGETLVSLYYVGLIAGVAVTAACALAVLPWSPLGVFDRIMRSVLFTLLGIELLLLPVNHGYLSVRRSLPRVGASTSARTWLVWEGKEGVTYLMREENGQRRLVTVARSEVKRTEIVAYDPVLAIIHRGGAAP